MRTSEYSISYSYSDKLKNAYEDLSIQDQRKNNHNKNKLIVKTRVNYLQQSDQQNSSKNLLAKIYLSGKLESEYSLKSIQNQVSQYKSAEELSLEEQQQKYLAFQDQIPLLSTFARLQIAALNILHKMLFFVPGSYCNEKIERIKDKNIHKVCNKYIEKLNKIRFELFQDDEDSITIINCNEDLSIDSNVYKDQSCSQIDVIGKIVQ